MLLKILIIINYKRYILFLAYELLEVVIHLDLKYAR
jgi:hypothetical protein